MRISKLEYRTSYYSLDITLIRVYTLMEKRKFVWEIEGIDHLTKRITRFRIKEDSLKRKCRYMYGLGELKSGESYRFCWETKDAPEIHVGSQWHLPEETRLETFLGYKKSKHKPFKLVSRLRYWNREYFKTNRPSYFND